MFAGGASPWSGLGARWLASSRLGAWVGWRCSPPPPFPKAHISPFPVIVPSAPEHGAWAMGHGAGDFYLHRRPPFSTAFFMFPACKSPPNIVSLMWRFESYDVRLWVGWLFPSTDIFSDLLRSFFLFRVPPWFVYHFARPRSCHRRQTWRSRSSIQSLSLAFSVP